MDFPRLRVRYNELYSWVEVPLAKLAGEQLTRYQINAPLWRAEMGEIEYVIQYFERLPWQRWQVAVLVVVAVLSVAVVAVTIWNP